VTRNSFVLEKKFSDVTQFLSYTGMVVGTMELGFRAQEIITGSFNFLGLQSARAVVTVGTGGPVAANTNPVMNASNNVARFLENLTAMGAGIFVPEVRLTLSNNTRPQDGIGSLDHVGIGLGVCDVKGSMMVYFSDGALYDKFKNNTASGIATVVQDADGKAYVFSLPRVEYTKGDVVVGGQNQDILVDMEFQAVRHPTLGTTVQIDRF
jgi:hypothetical protein